MPTIQPGGPLPRKHSPDGATETKWNSSCDSFATHFSTPEGWKAELADLSPISCKPSAGQGQFAGQRPAFRQLIVAGSCTSQCFLVSGWLILCAVVVFLFIWIIINRHLCNLLSKVHAAWKSNCPNSDWIEHGSSSTKHIIWSYREGFLRVKWPNQECRSTEGREAELLAHNA